MRRFATLCCGMMVFILGSPTLGAAPKPRKAPPGDTAPATAKAPTAGEPTARDVAARRTAPPPKAYQLAEPSPAVKRRVKKLRLDGNIMMYTGMGLSGLGLATTIAGVVLIALHRGTIMQNAGIGSLIGGAVALAGGVVLWAVGQSRYNKAGELLIKAKLRQARIEEPSPKGSGSGAHALVLPKTHTVFSAQLRF